MNKIPKWNGLQPSTVKSDEVHIKKPVPTHYFRYRCFHMKVAFFVDIDNHFQL